MDDLINPIKLTVSLVQPLLDWAKTGGVAANSLHGGDVAGLQTEEGETAGGDCHLLQSPRPARHQHTAATTGALATGQLAASQTSGPQVLQQTAALQGGSNPLLLSLGLFSKVHSEH